MAASGGSWKTGSFTPAGTTQGDNYTAMASRRWENMDTRERNMWLNRGGRETYVKATAIQLESLSNLGRKSAQRGS